MVHPPKNSGWLPGTGFANECKAEPLADNHLSSRGVVGFEPAPHIQRIEEKKHRHRAENAPDPLPKSSKNGGRRHSFGCPEGLGGTPKVDLNSDPVPAPIASFSGAPFFAIFNQHGLQNGGPFFRKFAERVVLRWLKTIPQAKNLENKGYRKGSRFGTSFGTSFGWNLS